MEPWNDTNISNTMNLTNKIPANKPVNKIPTIAIAIPYNSKFEVEWVDRTYVPLRYAPTDFCNKLFFMSKVPSLPVARDTLVSEVLKSNADYIFWVDTDIIFESPNDANMALKRLYQVINKDPNSKDTKMVSGLYRARQRQGFSYAGWLRANKFNKNVIKGYTPIESWTGNFIEIDVAGLGCCLMDTKVFRDIPKPLFYWETSEDISEDFYWFEKAKSYGYNLKLFTDVKCSHIGTVKLKSDGTFSMSEM